MKLLSWNVAGFRACLKKGFIDFFNEVNADIFCLQEIKAEKHQINFEAKGYYEYINSAERKGYSGTLIYSKVKPLKVNYGMGIDLHDNEGRMITLEYEKFFLINVYVPNVKRDLSRLENRMKWEEDFLNYVQKLKLKKPVIICGDFNVAHEEIDIKNVKANIGNAGFTYEERQKFTELLNIGLIDTYRQIFPNRKDQYTWWSYRKGVREKNIGWRIDYFLISKELLRKLEKPLIYSEIKGSDHCPIGLEIDIKI